MKSVFNIIIIILLSPVMIFAQEGSYVDKVVIDAGHGGKDPGALGRRSKEKDIALSIALKTGKYIEEKLPDVEVIYTRKTDKFVELHKRADIANKNNADLFISIHCNANRSSQPYGAETYVMGLHKSKENLEVAKKENAAILLEDNYREEYDGFDPNSDEGYISLSILQNVHLDQSIQMADIVQNQFRERVGLKDRSVRQAGFLLLYHTTMPGVLIETGFLSNKKEESFLLSKKGQTYIASAIFRAFRDYKQQMEKNLPPREKPSAKKKTQKSKELSKIYFSVQIDTSPKPKSLDNNNFHEPDKVKEYKHNGVYKYVYGEAASLSEARKMQKKMQKNGHKDAFVVAFQQNKRISVSEAMKIINNK
ncbi:MAG: N-acetylmuramoyl-L-alanine amidase family protein [Bacteroidota bacterium]